MIKNIAVIGAGTMGHGMAQVFARNGYFVSLYDESESHLNSAIDAIREELNFMIDEKFITQQELNEALERINPSINLEIAAKNADYVIEAIPEILELKQNLFRRLDEICSTQTVLSSNTSSLKLEDIIMELSDESKQRCMIAHWYNPAHLIPLVELSKYGNMSESVFNDVFELYVKCEKKPVCVYKDVTGMIANRLLHALAREAFHILEDGIGRPEDIDNAIMFGPCFRAATTGMFEIADMGGLDVWLAGEDNIFPLLDNSDKACGTLRKLVEEGNLGIKAGKGFYDYPKQKRQEVQREFFRRLMIQLKTSKKY